MMNHRQRVLTALRHQEPISPIHNVQTGVPPENVVAMFRTAREYGVTYGSA